MPPANFAARRLRLVERLSALEIDALLISSPTNVTYLTGFTGDSSFLLMSGSDTTIVSDGRYSEQIADECPGLAMHIRTVHQNTPEVVAELAEKKGQRRLGFESQHISVATLESFREKAKSLDWKPIKGEVETLRMIKDAEEVAQICEAIAIAERSFAMFQAMLRPDDSELRLTDALEEYVRRAGGRGTSFPSIVAVGERSALAHAPPGNRPLCSGAFVLVDWGAHNGLYRSDLTRILRPRTSWFHPVPPSRDDTLLATVYRTVLAAQTAAIAAIRPGAEAKTVDAAARKVIADAGYEDKFTHGTGHGIGLQTHEGPGLRATSEDVLAAGMVVTVEPGIYLPGWGGVRIEDDVLVTPDAKVLSSLPRNFEATLI